MLNLIKWYQNNKRNLPWRTSRDPYRIWLSEIILQQTRVDQGLDYYKRFICEFPTVHQLANAEIDEVLLLWQGLGYYSRARNLHETAKVISIKYQGKFPNNYSELINLKGVGDYTASAIASIAFGKTEAVVDGNVYRVLSRYFSDYTPINTSEGKKRFKLLASEVLNISNPGVHNEAIMELGAVICKPKNPECDGCPINDSCSAYSNNTTAALPVNHSKIKVKKRYMYFFILERGKNVYIQKREGNDIWKGLFQFPCIDLPKELKSESLLESAFNEQFIAQDYTILSVSEKIKHVLSHQHIFAQFIHIKLQNAKPGKDYLEVQKSELHQYAMPRIITRHLENYTLQ